MLMSSSFWRRAATSTRPGQSWRLLTSTTPATADLSAANPRVRYLLPVTLAALGVAVGCAAEERTFGQGATPDAAAPDGGDATQSTGAQGSDSSVTTDDVTSPGGDESSQAPSTGPDATEDTTTNELPDTGETDGATVGNDRTTDGNTTEVVTTSDTQSSDDIDLGVGEPPDYGNLGSGDARILVVNALQQAASVDVWLAGGAAPIVENLSPEAASRVTVTRGAQRVVFTSAGTHDVMGCSEWFPLRGDEQWAVVTSGGDHTCIGGGDGATSSFRQAQPLDENPVRYVHATTPDTFVFARDDEAEPGQLAAGETLTGTSLPNCTSGCEVRYRLSAEGIDGDRYFTLAVNTTEELPPAGEVMVLVLGNVRQDWPSEPDSLRLLRVDLDGTTYLMSRDPEVAFGRLGETVATFSISTPPSTTEIATADPACGNDTCPLETRVWRTGARTFFVETAEGYAEIAVELEAGHRYVLLSTTNSVNPLYWLDADFDRSQTTKAYAAAINLDGYGDSLSFGYVFSDNAVAIDTLTTLPWGEVSAENGGNIPAEENWHLVTALGSESLGTSCFYSMDTTPGFRGYFVAADWMQPLDITAWPPSIGALPQQCF